LNGKKVFSILLSVVVLTVPVVAQSSGRDSSDSFSSSRTWTYAGIGGTVAVTAILVHYDQQIYDELYAWEMNNPAVKKTSLVITNLGGGTFSAGLFAGFAGYGLIFKDKKAFEAGKIGIESFLFTGVAAQVFKHLCGRERPSNSTRPGGFWHGPSAFLHDPRGTEKRISSFDAFPSGHTTTVFSAATTIADFYTEPWVSYTCYSLAALTGVSRVTESTHWLSDVFVGAIIGHYGAKLVEYWNYGSKGFAVQPIADDHQYGLLLTVKF